MGKTLQQVKADKKKVKNNNITDSDYVLRDKDAEDIQKNTINMTPTITDLSPEDIEKQRVIQEKIDEAVAEQRQKEIDEAVEKGVEEALAKIEASKKKVTPKPKLTKAPTATEITEESK